jgi:hypothetical protein
MHLSIPAALAAILLTAANAAALSPSDKCESGKLKEAGKYGLCRLKAEARAVKQGGTPDYSKCDAKIGEKWAGLESDAGGECPSNGDETAVRAFVTQHTSGLAAALNGGFLLNCLADLTTCYNDLSTCLDAPQGQPGRTGQTDCFDAEGGSLPCAGSGQDGELQKGLVASFTDNGDGTITDNRTGLMWEKLSDDGSIHDKDDAYLWAAAFSVKIATLNSTAFAGYTDWRLPNIKELQSLSNFGVMPPAPAVFPPFNSGCVPGCTVTSCSCTLLDVYWSSTSYQNLGTLAWKCNSTDGGIDALPKTMAKEVRAVRGGS